MHFFTKVCIAGFFASYVSATPLPTAEICFLGIPVSDVSYTSFPNDFTISVQYANFTGDQLPLKYDDHDSRVRAPVTITAKDSRTQTLRLENGVIYIQEAGFYRREFKKDGELIVKSYATSVQTVTWRAQYICKPDDTPVLALMPTNTPNRKSILSSHLGICIMLLIFVVLLQSYKYMI